MTAGRRKTALMRGGVLIEFCLSLMFLIPLLLGVISLCRLVHERSVVMDGIRQAARAAARIDAEAFTPTEYRAEVLAAARFILDRVLSQSRFDPSQFRLGVTAEQLAADRSALELVVERVDGLGWWQDDGCMRSRFVVEGPLNLTWSWGARLVC